MKLLRRAAELALHLVWVLGHEKYPDGSTHCRWCGLETRHIRAARDVFTGETVYTHNTACPIYWAGTRSVLLGRIRPAPNELDRVERREAIRK